MYQLSVAESQITLKLNGLKQEPIIYLNFLWVSSLDSAYLAGSSTGLSWGPYCIYG